MILFCVDGSPVMDALRDGARSGQSSPSQGQRERRPSSRTSAGAQNGRGGRGRGMFRGRGYRGGGQPNPNFRGGAQSGRGGFRPGVPLGKKESLKFEKDYDFEEANKEFSEVLSKLQVKLQPIVTSSCLIRKISESFLSLILR